MIEFKDVKIGQRFRYKDIVYFKVGLNCVFTEDESTEQYMSYFHDTEKVELISCCEKCKYIGRHLGPVCDRDSRYLDLEEHGMNPKTFSCSEFELKQEGETNG